MVKVTVYFVDGTIIDITMDISEWTLKRQSIAGWLTGNGVVSFNNVVLNPRQVKFMKAEH